MQKRFILIGAIIEITIIVLIISTLKAVHAGNKIRISDVAAQAQSNLVAAAVVDFNCETGRHIVFKHAGKRVEYAPVCPEDNEIS